jgi:predicted transcriptional regulator
MKAVSVKLPDPLFHDLAERAKAASVSQSELLRHALQVYLKSDDQAPIASCAARADRWIGLVEGPKDLATNPKHLRGFGK